MSRKKPLEIHINDVMNVEQNGVYQGKVVKCGNGAIIYFYKQFIGEEVLIVRVSKLKKTTDKPIKKEIFKKNKDGIIELTPEQSKAVTDYYYKD